ncbi:hypothetical protein ACHAP5_002917 [Fusarium lateritium]
MPPTRRLINFDNYPDTNKLRHGKFCDVLIHRLSQHGVSRGSRIRTEEQRLRDIEKIKEYRHLENQIFTHAASGDYDSALFQLTTKLLQLSPEHYTAWNVRRRCLISSLFTKPSDQQRSNAQAIFRLRVAAAREMWHTELGLTSLMLEKDPRNFHAWGYRRILIEKLESPELEGKNMAEDEFAYTTKIIHSNLSNFSAWYHRSRVISRLLQERAAEGQERAAFLDQELNFVRRALDVGPEDHSLWYYHQFLMSQIINDGSGQASAWSMDVREKTAYVRREIDNIKDLLEDYDDVKWIYQALLEYTLILERLDERARDEGGLGGLKQAWLTKLRTLDPMRAGRWDDVEKGIQLGEAKQ